MATQIKTQTAQDLGLMQGYPPPTEKRVTHANQLFAPYNRWSFQNELKLNFTAEVWRGTEAPFSLDKAFKDLGRVSYQNMAGERFSFEDMLEMSYTDGIIVMQHGEIIYERYQNGMQAHTLHAWASGSKSLTGVLAALLAHEGLFDPNAPVATYLPELSRSGFGDASIRQVMDMTSAVAFAGQRSSPVAENWEYGVVMGWCEKPQDYNGSATIYELLPSMIKTGPHGQRFHYLTPNTDVLAWLLKRLTQKSLAELMSERIWSKLGVERDAYWIVGEAAVETSGSGLVTTLSDMARFGQMLLQKGAFNGKQILPAAVVEDIEGGGDREAFARGAAANPSNRGYSYRNQWWVTHNPYGAYMAMGYGGQILYIAPAADLVVAKFSSYPTPTPAGNEFYSTLAALPSLAKSLAE